MTTIDDVSTNDMNFKHLDTSKDIVITPMNEYGGKVLLNADHTWTAKVSDGNNYVGDYPVTIEPNGIVVNSSDFTNLPAGQYHLEVWEEWIDSNSIKQRSIYPSPQRTIDFTIYQNVTDLAEKEIKTIGFQDVVDQAVMNVWDNYVIKVNMIESDQTATVVQSVADGKNYVTFNVPRGDVGPAPTLKIGTVTKLNSDQTPTANISGDNGAYTLDLGIPQGAEGKTGTVDNAGLISAPAFQSLQSQVNNSAVGTNLYSDTKNFGNPALWCGFDSWTKITDTYKGFDVMRANAAWGGLSQYIQAKKGDVVTYSVYARYTSDTGTSMIYFQLANEIEGSYNSATTDSNGSPVTITDSWQRVSATAVVTGDGYLRPRLEQGDQNTNTMHIAGIKVEKGSVATPWSPNPSEILTQADYAKIQAAIVALGGSLS